MLKRPLNPLAGELNAILSRDGCAAASLLSERGLRAYFPHHGILGQGVDAKGCAINATLGTAKEDDGSPLRLQCLSDLLAIPDASFLYAPSFGVPELRKYWADAQLAKNPSLVGIPHSLPVVTNALTHALFMAAQMVVGRGEKVIIPNYFWDNYDLIFNEAFGGVFDTFPTFSRGHFNVAALRRKLLGRGEKKIVVLNFPNNPTGYTPTIEEADAIQAAFLEAAQAGKR
ncbi:MAG: aminotransferase class I/II-fold pyridoxal phosphate-dependent enzyme, partial [Kiritimatiellae bacterium]|nr:aminotransferase class I/II-fold pyridoxal phosphate-dependent enzyme [Kiritimatiellia bacterium]